MPLRSAMTAEQVVERSSEIVARFFESASLAPDQWKGLRVSLYQALPGEIDLHELELDLVDRGVTTCYPRILDLNARTMDFVDLTSPKSLNDPNWEVGPMGVLQPARGRLPAVPPDKIDLFIVPGLGFGQQGERVGRGSGFYDRYLSRATEQIRVALAFDFQLFEEIDQAPWDQQVDWIVTETHIGVNDRAAEWLTAKGAKLE